MARLPRLTVPGHPHHIIQRGNNRQLIFVDDIDRERMLALLIEHALACQVMVHAYVLMDNHMHLLATPQVADGVPKMMQAVGRRYARHFNQRHGRTGTLWEGRYRATVIEAGRYLLACMVYIDLHPVRAGLVAQVRDWRWSSHAHYIGLQQDRLVTRHGLWWTLGNTPFAREAAYADRIQAGLTVSQQQALTDATLRGWALGSDAFISQLQAQTDRRTRPKLPGRPTKRTATD